LKRAWPARSLLLAATTLAATAAFAATPDAGQALQAVQPAPALAPRAGAPIATPADTPRPAMRAKADEARFTLAAVRFSGNAAVTGEELQALAADVVGRTVGLAELRDLADRVTDLYRQRGFLLARAYVPAQAIEGGTVEIAVLEGRLGRATLRNGSGLVDEAFDAHKRLAEGAALQRDALERSVLLMNDLAGARVSATLVPGEAVGTADLLLDAQPLPRVSGSLELDDHGDHYTGQARMGASLNVASPLNRGDLLRLRLLTTGSGMNYARAHYLLPIGPDGLRAGATLGALHYEVGHELASLGADGHAIEAGLDLGYPLVRSEARNLGVQAAYTHRSLSDRIASSATTTDKTLDELTLSLAGDLHTDRAVASGSLAWTHGRLAIDTPAAAAVDAATARTAGSFDKATASLLAQVQVTETQGLYGSLFVQQAGRNLDSSERMTLGGAWGVRAYPQGEAAGDDGALGSVEWRFAAAPRWQLAGFVDAGLVHMNHRPWDGAAQRRRLAGAGLGVNGQPMDDLALRASVAWKVHGQPATAGRDHNPQLWLQLVKSL